MIEIDEKENKAVSQKEFIKIKSMKLRHVILILLIGSFVSKASAQDFKVLTQSLMGGVVPRNAVALPMLKVELTALDDATLESVVLERAGLSTSEDIGRVWGQTDTFRRTNKRQFTNDDQVELTFNTPLNFAKGERQTLTVYANLNFESGGKTLFLNLLELKSQSSGPSISVPKVLSPREPEVVQSRSYDRSKYKIRCKGGTCRLVER